MALDLDTLFAEAYCNLGVLLHSQGYLTEASLNYEKALSIYSKIMINNPDNMKVMGKIELVNESQ